MRFQLRSNAICGTRVLAERAAEQYINTYVTRDADGQQHINFVGMQPGEYVIPAKSISAIDIQQEQQRLAKAVLDKKMDDLLREAIKGGSESSNKKKRQEISILKKNLRAALRGGGMA